MALNLITYNDKSNYQSSALADEYKVTDDDMNEIKSVVNDAVSQLDNSITRSSSEKVIGFWTDGKPIYRRVIPFTTPATETDYNIDTSSYNVNYMLRMYGGIYISGGSTTQIPHTIWFGSSYYYTSFRGDTNKVIYRGSTNYGNKQATLVIEYTKTTD